MKKPIIFSLIILMSSCSQHEIPENSIPNYDLIIQGLEDMHTSNLNFAFENLNSVLSKQKKSLILDENKLSKSAFLENSISFFNDQLFINDSYFEMFEESRIIDEELNSRVLNFDLTYYSGFNQAQKSIAQPFVNNILNNVFNSYQANSYVTNFNNQVINSTLSEEEKLELLSLSSATSSLGVFIDNNGVQLMSNFIQTLGYEPYRLQGCSVSFRNVWTSGVVGFFGGGISGGVIGCGGGTVVLPGVGTVTGCVGGAVFGATYGFVSGSVAGVASELISTCFRGGSPIEEPVDHRIISYEK